MEIIPEGLLRCLEVWEQFWWGETQKNNHVLFFFQGGGGENWNRGQARSSLKCFRMPPESKDPRFYCSLCSEVTSLQLSFTRIHHRSPRFTGIMLVGLKRCLYDFNLHSKALPRNGIPSVRLNCRWSARTKMSPGIWCTTTSSSYSVTTNIHKWVVSTI